MQAWMQINDKVLNPLMWVLKLLILGACIFYIVSEIDETWHFEFSDVGCHWSVVVLVLVLSVANWSLEVWRWKYSLEQAHRTSWREATKQVFAGLALNWVVPFTGGDAIARLYPNVNKKKAVVLIYWNRTVMLVITVLFGLYGVYWYSAELFQSKVWLVTVFIMVLFGGGALLNRVLVKSTSLGWKFISNLVILSLVRYGVFTLQFYLLIRVFNPEFSDLLILAGIGWIFLFRSVIPSLFGNLGVREASALVFFEATLPNAVLILIPSFLIWIINTILPSFLGLYFIIRFPIKIAE